jgi:hypothetical protein
MNSVSVSKETSMVETSRRRAYAGLAALLALSAVTCMTVLTFVVRQGTRDVGSDVDMFGTLPAPAEQIRLAIDLTTLPTITCEVAPDQLPPRDDVQYGTAFVPFSKLTEALNRR